MATDQTEPSQGLAHTWSTLRPIGRIRPRASSSIASSKINIGCECLDREMWSLDQAAEALAATGAKHARVQTGWSRCETEAGKFEFDWLDRIVVQILQLGIQPWFNISYGHPLYTDAPAKDAVGWTPTSSSTAMRAWQRYVEQLALHFRDRVTEFEIWNEPDLGVFWKPAPPDPIAYSRLVESTARVIRQTAPEIRIVAGGLAHGTEAWGLQFLDTCLRAGIKPYLDAISFHCYRPRPEGQSIREIEAIRALLKRHNLDVPLWEGECGCPSEVSTAEAMANQPWNEEKQAKWITRRLIIDLARDLDRVTHFHLSDFHNYYKDGPVNQPAYFGLLRNETYEPKPSFRCFQSICSLFDSNTQPDPELMGDVEIDLSQANSAAQHDWLLVQVFPFARHGFPLLAYWYPAELHPEHEGVTLFAQGSITIKLAHVQGLRMQRPVLIDPLEQQVFEIEGKDIRTGLRFEDLPLLDRPLFITEFSAIACCFM